MLKVKDLSAGYGAINILWNLNFEIGDGEIVAFLGSNGAGKTTTVRAVTGLIRPSSGSVNFNGEELARKSSRAILDAGLVQVPEGRQLFTDMTGRLQQTYPRSISEESENRLRMVPETGRACQSGCRNAFRR